MRIDQNRPAFSPPKGSDGRPTNRFQPLGSSKGDDRDASGHNIKSEDK